LTQTNELFNQKIVPTIMKFILICSAILVICSSFSPKYYSLTVQIYGFGDNTGKSFVGLYRPSDPWPEIKKQYMGKVVSIVNKTATICFQQLEAGTYAVAVFHDKNNNGLLDKNMLGIPVERYGFSNNARETFNAPSFKNASIDLNTDRSIGIYVK
jgi:uncharacterized protein (DUF2141 family)